MYHGVQYLKTDYLYYFSKLRSTLMIYNPYTILSYTPLSYKIILVLVLMLVGFELPCAGEVLPIEKPLDPNHPISIQGKINNIEEGVDVSFHFIYYMFTVDPGVNPIIEVIEGHPDNAQVRQLKKAYKEWRSKESNQKTQEEKRNKDKNNSDFLLHLYDSRGASQPYKYELYKEVKAGATVIVTVPYKDLLKFLKEGGGLIDVLEIKKGE